MHHKGAHGTGTYHQHSGELPGAGGAVLPPPSTLPRTGEYGPGEFVPGGFYGGLIGDGAADRPPTVVQVGALSDLCSATLSRASNDHATPPNACGEGLTRAPCQFAVALPARTSKDRPRRRRCALRAGPGGQAGQRAGQGGAGGQARGPGGGGKSQKGAPPPTPLSSLRCPLVAPS